MAALASAARNVMPLAQTPGAPNRTGGSTPTLPAAGTLPLPGIPSPDSRALRKQVFADMLWALMSGAEFQFNH